MFVVFRFLHLGSKEKLSISCYYTGVVLADG